MDDLLRRARPRPEDARRRRGRAPQGHRLRPRPDARPAARDDRRHGDECARPLRRGVVRRRPQRGGRRTRPRRRAADRRVAPARRRLAPRPRGAHRAAARRLPWRRGARRLGPRARPRNGAGDRRPLRAAARHVERDLLAAGPPLERAVGARCRARVPSGRGTRRRGARGARRPNPPARARRSRGRPARARRIGREPPRQPGEPAAGDAGGGRDAAALGLLAHPDEVDDERYDEQHHDRDHDSRRDLERRLQNVSPPYAYIVESR